MAKHKVAVTGTVGRTITIDDSLPARVAELEEALRTLSAQRDATKHSALQGLQVGNDHPQYPLKQARETIKGQWDFTKQVWASSGTNAAPGYAFTAAQDSGWFAVPPSGDPYFASVSLLLTCDGANGSTTFTDLSNTAHTMTVTGTGAVSTAGPKFGTGALATPGGFSGWLATSLDAALNLASTDFTVEFWFKPSAGAVASGSNQVLIGCRDGSNASGLTIFFNGTAQQVRTQTYGTGGVSADFTGTFVAGTWYHVALVVSGTSQTVYVDGIGSTTTGLGALTAFAAAEFRIGGDFFSGIIGSTFNGEVDEVRVTRTARYTANFTPPTAAFPNSGSAGYVAMSVGGDERFRFTSSNDIGIGGANFGTSRQSLLSGGAGSPVSWQTLVHTDIADWDEAVQDTVGAMFVDSARIDFTYNDGAGTETADLVANSVSDTYLRQGAATSVIGRSAGTVGNVADIAAAADDRVLSRTGGTLGFGQLTVGMAPNSVWTYAKIQNVSATNRVLGRISSGAGVVEELTGADLLTILGASGLSGANPSASVGLSAVNGSATTYMRSDGAPALSQSIAPNWTGFHTFSNAAGMLVASTASINTAFSENPNIIAERSIKVVRTSGANFRGLAAGSTGTLASPGGVRSADVLFAIAGGGYDTSSWRTSQAGFQFNATENWSTTALGSNAEVFVTPNGATASVTVARFDASTTSGDIRLLLYDVAAGTLVRVSRGAADSGGVGFRLLRVPN